MVHAGLEAWPHACLAAMDPYHLCGALEGCRIAEPMTPGGKFGAPQMLDISDTALPSLSIAQT